MEGRAAVAFKDASFSYGSKGIIDHLDLELGRGRVTSVIGPNGCGKSTMVKLIAGMLRPTAGSVEIFGKPTLSYSAKERAKVLAVLSQRTREPVMTVEELIACGRYPYLPAGGRLSAEDRDAIQRAAADVGIEDLLAKPLRALSGGERQKAYLAMTIAQDTELIVLDEPTTYLDVRASYDLMGLIRKLNREAGKTVVMVLHDIGLALRTSDELVVIGKDRSLCVGDPKELISSGSIAETFDVQVIEHAIDGETYYSLI